ncbi:MAG: hypothetical protein DI570_09250 [Phenylobacterium zucineum]|nr:MAG: hypothetical protein DI570_09250 [Phenylobacterium zucineum]
MPNVTRLKDSLGNTILINPEHVAGISEQLGLAYIHLVGTPTPIAVQMDGGGLHTIAVKLGFGISG